MQKKDIVIGQEYCNLDYPGTKYLGIGLRTEKYGLVSVRNKGLVVLTGEFAGRIVHKNESNTVFWSKFRKKAS